MPTNLQNEIMAETRIRNIPDALWRQFKSLCVLQGEKVNDKLIELVRLYVDSMSGKRK